MEERKMDSVDYEIEFRKQDMVDRKSNATNAEIADTLMYVVLAFMTGGLFIPFLIYHLYHHSRKTREISNETPYLIEGVDELNRNENLLGEDKQYFFEHPMSYKVGYHQYAEFEPETKNMNAMITLNYKSRNPRFKYGEHKDEWYNKPYWDIVEKQRKEFVRCQDMGSVALRYKRAQLLDQQGKREDNYDQIAQLYYDKLDQFTEQTIRIYKWYIPQWDDDFGNCDADFVRKKIDECLAYSEWCRANSYPMQRNLLSSNYERGFGFNDKNNRMLTSMEKLLEAEVLMDNFKEITGKELNEK